MQDHNDAAGSEERGYDAPRDWNELSLEFKMVDLSNT